MDPRQVAEAVVALADNPRDSIGVGAPVGLMKLAQLLGPNLAAAATRRAIMRGLERSKPVPATAGNLFVPPAETGRVDGGFRGPQRRNLAAAAAGLTGIAALLIGGAWLARRQTRRI
jgi:hypothetical protein